MPSTTASTAAHRLSREERLRRRSSLLPNTANEQDEPVVATASNTANPVSTGQCSTRASQAAAAVTVSAAETATTTTTAAAADTTTASNDEHQRGQKRASGGQYQGTAQPKKARAYSLRSATARKAAPAGAAAAPLPTVTPGTLVRHLDFQDAATTATLAHASLPLQSFFPAGVVNIFASCTSRTAPAPAATTRSCACLADVIRAQDTSLAVQHISHYGAEYAEILRAKEDAQMAALQALLPTESANEQNQAEEAMDDEASSPGTPCPGTVLQYRPSAVTAAKRDSKAGPSEKTQKLPQQPYLSPKMRTILINWLVEVSQEYKLSEDAYHLAVTLLDWILTRGPTASQLLDLDVESDDEAHDDDYDIDASAVMRAHKPDRKPFVVLRNEFQALGWYVLLACCPCRSRLRINYYSSRTTLTHCSSHLVPLSACAWIASKMEDKDSPSFDDFVYISDHSFSSHKLRSLETRICKELDFRLHRVTPLHFINEYLRASHACPNSSCEFDHSVLRNMVMYLLELGRLPYELTGRKPSLLAASALYLARATMGLREHNTDHAVDRDGYWTKTLQHYTGYTTKDLKNTVLMIHEYQLAAEESNYNASFNKYRSRKFKCVSLRTVLRTEELGMESHDNYDNLEIDESGARFDSEAA